MRRRGGGGLAGAQVNDVAHDGNRNDAALAGVGADGKGEPRLGTVAGMLARAESRNVAVSRARPSSMTRFPGPSGASRRAATCPEPGLGVLS
jgi:hypothetical protein